MYQNIQQTADFYGISRRTVSRRVREMEKLPRYPERTVLRGDKLVLVDMDAFEDFMINRKRLLCEATRKYVPFTA